MKKYLICILILLASITFGVVNAGDLADVQQSGTLRLGVSPEYIPFVFYDNSGETTGIDVALVKEIARRMDLDVKVYNLAYDGMIDSLDLGQVDIIAGAFSKTEEREQLIDFTRAYYTGDAQFIAKSTLTKPAQVELADFQNLKIGVQKGTSFDQWVKTNLVNAGYVSAQNVYTFASADEEVRALDRGDVDLIVLDQDVYEDLYRATGNYQIFYENLAQEKYAFGLRKGSDLTDVVNGHLTDMIKDGTAQSIADRFFKMDFSEAQINNTRPSIIPTATPLTPIYIPTQVVSCKNGMTFVTDVTITDGHQVSRGEGFRKIWRVQNTGTCPWTPAYSFVYVSGDQMSGRNINIPGTVQPGQTVDLAVDFIAPTADGTYRGYWQMRSPQGQNFGESIWVKVRVNGGGGGGNKPQINYFYANPDSGYVWDSTTVFWSVSNASSVDIAVDGNVILRSNDATGSVSIGTDYLYEGNHNFTLTAHSSYGDSVSSVNYRASEGQVMTVPIIDYFYVDPDSGYVWDSTTAYWSVSNTSSIDISVDGINIQSSTDPVGSCTIDSSYLNEGTHSIVLTAHSVTTDTTSTVYYEASEGQVMTVPIIDSFYVDPDSGYTWDSPTAYWSVSNASSIDISVDGYTVESSTDSAGAVSLGEQSEGTHAITLTAHSVTTDTDSTVYYEAHEGQGGLIVDDNSGDGDLVEGDYY